MTETCPKSRMSRPPGPSTESADGSPELPVEETIAVTVTELPATGGEPELEPELTWMDPDRIEVPPTPAELWAAVEFYALGGWRVFALQTGLKIPYGGSRGFKDATSDLDTLRGLWEEFPNSNIGLATGHSDDCVGDCYRCFDVLDLDVKNGIDGGLNIDAYADEHGHDWGDLGEDFDDLRMVVGTPSGGLHLFVGATGAGNAPPLGGIPGVDWRGKGGYVVAAPSWSAAQGRRYVWAPGHELRDPPQCPAWLRRPSTSRVEPSVVSVPQNARIDLRGHDCTAYGATALEGECQRVVDAAVGTRNAQLNTAAMKAAQLVGGGELADGFARDNLLKAALLAGLGERESLLTIESGFKKGLTEPRTARTSDLDDGSDYDLGLWFEPENYDQLLDDNLASLDAEDAA